MEIRRKELQPLVSYSLTCIASLNFSANGIRLNGIENGNEILRRKIKIMAVKEKNIYTSFVKNFLSTNV